MDLRYNLNITFRQAAKGDEVTLKIPVSVPCESCKGSGAEPGTEMKTCGHAVAPATSSRPRASSASP